MGFRLVVLALVIGGVGLPRAAVADGVCVAIDVSRDTLGEPERVAVRIAILEALRSEGVAVDEGPSCRGFVTAYNIQLGKAITTTLSSGDHSVTGRASSLDELDLSIRQLVRSLVTGRSLATGFGVTDRTNVLRDQTAPRRVDARSARRWDPVFAIGGGMLQLPPIEGRALQRQNNIVAIEVRQWGFLTSERSALELFGRLLLHDYAVLGDAHDAYRDERDDGDRSGAELGRGTALVFSPFAVANWEGGLGLVGFAGDEAPRPFFRAGATTSFLFRLSDPDHRFDLGLGGYAGLGLQLTKHVGISLAVNASSPVFHDFADSGYWYFLTATAMLEIRGKGREQRPPSSLLGPEPAPVPVIRRINE